jgi:hypothetical protein
MQSTDPKNDPKQARPSRDGRTPNADMQAEDAGTPESGNEGTRAAAAGTAVKQEQKTDAEAGEGRKGQA